MVAPQVLGKEHPSVAESYNNLALVTSDLRADAEALQYSEKCMHIARNVYPPDHPQVAPDHPATSPPPSSLPSLRRSVRVGCTPCVTAVGPGGVRLQPTMFRGLNQTGGGSRVRV